MPHLGYIKIIPAQTHELDDLIENNSELKKINIVTNVKQFCDHYSKERMNKYATF